MKLCPQCETGYPDQHVTCPTHGVMLGEIRDLRAGMLIRNTYRVVRKLGQGGMGAVYLCEHTLMDERQALKFLSAELSRDQNFTSRFLREVRTLRQVRHRNVVDAGNLEPAEDGTLFFSMEYVDGPNLREFLDKAPKPMDVGLALGIVRGIAEGLGAAHGLGMVHRDIKPENILMARAGDGYLPKIADFGIVATKESSSLYTRTGGTLLTMAYAAPEQWKGMRAADLDGRADLYALGGVLFELLTGQTVFEAESYEEWAEQHRNGVPRRASSLRPDLKNWPGLDDLMERMLAKDREQRPRDVAELLGLLDSVTALAPEGMAGDRAKASTARTRVVTELVEAKTDSGLAVAGYAVAGQSGAGLAVKTGGAGLVETSSPGKTVKRIPGWAWAAIAGVVVAGAFAAGMQLRQQPEKQEHAAVATPQPAIQPQPEQPKPAGEDVVPTADGKAGGQSGASATQAGTKPTRQNAVPRAPKADDPPQPAPQQQVVAPTPQPAAPEMPKPVPSPVPAIGAQGSSGSIAKPEDSSKLNMGATVSNYNSECDHGQPEGCGELEKACNAGTPVACYYLGAQYQFGNHMLHKDSAKAHSYYAEACSLGYQQGCDAAKKVKGSSLFHWHK